MLCYLCDAPAVAVCRECGVGLCRAHFDETERAYRHKMTYMHCGHREARAEKTKPASAAAKQGPR